MRSTPESGSPPADTQAQAAWRRPNRRYALVLVVLIHLAMLAAMLLSRARRPEPPPVRSVDVALFEEKVPEQIPEPPPASIAPPAIAPPPLLVPPPLPVLDVVPDAIRAPASVPAPAPGPAATPAPTPAAPSPPPPPVKETVASAPPKLFEECGEASDRQMVADVYRLTPGSQSVAEMRRRKPVKRVCLAQLDIAPRPFRDGFPGLGSPVEWFGLDIRFTVNIAETATWELMLLADDGAILSIDDENVIHNDGIHAPTPVATRVKLEKGVRHFRVRYFQGPGPDLALMLAWKKPGAADYSYLPRSLIGRPPAGTLAQIQPAE